MASLKRMMLVLLLLTSVVLLSVPAEAQFRGHDRRDRLENRIESSLGWRNNNTLTFVNNNLLSRSAFDIGLTGGFEFAVSYRPWQYLYGGGILTHYTNSGNTDLQALGSTSNTRLGISGFLATPWTRISDMKYQNLFWRAKIGGVYDATGLNVKSWATSGRVSQIGRLRESRIFFSTEIGVKCFGAESTGMVFLRFSYIRSMYSFSASGSSVDYVFDSGDNNHLCFDIGISLWESK